MKRLLIDIVRDVMSDMAYRRWRYIPDFPDEIWKSTAEFEADGGGDCLTLDQKIICRDKKTGLYALPSLEDLRKAYHEYEALSYDFSSRKFVFNNITNWQSKGKQRVVKVRLGNGSTFKATPDHVVWVSTSHSYTVAKKLSMKVKETRISDIDLAKWHTRQIVVANQIPALMKPYDRTVAYLDGIYAAEGYKHSKNTVRIAQDKQDIRKKIEAALDSLSASYSQSKRKTHAYYGIHISELSKHFLKCGGSDSFEKKFPLEALSSTHEVIQSLLEGHSDGDAYIPKVGAQKYGRIECVAGTSSDELKRHIVLACLVLGRYVNSWLQVRHGGVGKEPIWRLYVRAENREKLGVLRGYDGLGYNGIRSIVNDGTCEVADITVADTHNFILDSGVVVHNCEDHCHYLIVKTGLIDSEAKLRMVVGDVYLPVKVGDSTLYEPRRHAWVALLSGSELWCDPTPGWSYRIGPPTTWARSAKWGRNYEPERLGYTDKFVYGD